MWLLCLLQSEHAPAPAASQCDQHTNGSDMCSLCLSLTSLQHMFYSNYHYKFQKAKNKIKNHFCSTHATLQNLSTVDLPAQFPDSPFYMLVTFQDMETEEGLAPG